MQPSSSVLSLAGGIGVSEALLIVKEGFEVIVPLLLAESIVSHLRSIKSARLRASMMPS